MTIDFETAKQQVEASPAGHSDEAKSTVIAAVGEREYQKLVHAAAGTARVGIAADPTGTRKTFVIGVSQYGGGLYVEREPTTTSQPPPSTDHGPMRPVTGERFIENYSGPQIRSAPTAPTAATPQANAGNAEAKFAQDPLTLTREDVAALKAKWGASEYSRRAQAWFTANSGRKVTVR